MRLNSLILTLVTQGEKILSALLLRVWCKAHINLFSVWILTNSCSFHLPLICLFYLNIFILRTASCFSTLYLIFALSFFFRSEALLWTGLSIRHPLVNRIILSIWKLFFLQTYIPRTFSPWCPFSLPPPPPSLSLCISFSPLSLSLDALSKNKKITFNLSLSLSLSDKHCTHL